MAVESCIPKWIPLLTPAVKEGEFEIDQELIATRKKVTLATALVFSLIGLTMGLLLANPFLCLPALGVAFAILLTLLFEEGIAERAIDEKAVHEYVSKHLPDAKAMKWIGARFEAVELLTKKEKNLNKIDAQGRCLLDWYFDFTGRSMTKIVETRIFTHLIDNGFDLFARHSKERNWLQALIPGLSYYFQYALKKVKDRLSADEQFRLWLCANTLGSLNLLKESGIDINAKGSNGQTFLHMVVYHARRLNKEFTPLPYEFVKWLISNGANVFAEDDQGRTPLDVCRNASFPTEAEKAKVLQILSALENAADATAVDEFVSSHYPSAQAIERIQKSTRAAELLVRTGEHRKPSRKVDKLLVGQNSDSLPTIEVLNYLVENGLRLNLTETCTPQTETCTPQIETIHHEEILLDKPKKRYFRMTRLAYILESPLSTPAHIDCVLRNGRIEPSIFSDKEQNSLWTAARKRNVQEFMSNMGFTWGLRPRT